MNQATCYFHAELNDFLAPGRRGAPFRHTFEGRVSIKDMVESLGVPHTEIEALVVSGQAVDFSYLVRDGDQVAAYPALGLPPNLPYAPLRPPLPAEPRFVLDTHLGQLATYLRMLGFDTLYRNDYADEELARISSAEGRILLTRDRGLLKRSIVTYGRYVRETDPQRQVAEVVRHYRLAAAIAPLRRCIRCNGLLHAVRKDEIGHRLEPKTREFYDQFSVCAVCDQIYWKGSHYERMLAFIERLLVGEEDNKI